MPILAVNAYKPEEYHCGFAAIASLGNYFNKDIDYEYVKKSAQKIKISSKQGMYTPEIGIILNSIGFKKVKIISSDIVSLDFSWFEKKSKTLVIKNLNSIKDKNTYINIMLKFLRKRKFNNSLEMSYNFKNKIMSTIDKGIPLIISFNATMLAMQPKVNRFGHADINGSWEDHATCCCGYEDDGIYIADTFSHLYSFGKVICKKKNIYFIPWEVILICMCMEDIVIASNFEN